METLNGKLLFAKISFFCIFVSTKKYAFQELSFTNKIKFSEKNLGLFFFLYEAKTAEKPIG